MLVILIHTCLVVNNASFSYQNEIAKDPVVKNTKQIRVSFKLSRDLKMKPSLSFIASGIFLLFIARSIWSLYSLWQSPKCNNLIRDICYHSFLNDNPKLDLVVFLNDNSKSGKYDLILRLEEFDYRSQIER